MIIISLPALHYHLAHYDVKLDYKIVQGNATHTNEFNFIINLLDRYFFLVFTNLSRVHFEHLFQTR